MRKPSREIVSSAVNLERTMGVHISLGPEFKFAKQLMAYRLEQDMGRKDLARLAGVKVSQLRDWEEADAYPTDEQIANLAGKLARDGDALEVAEYWKYLVGDAKDYLLETGRDQEKGKPE